jgi:peptide/nickel transport system permease protein
MVVDENLMVVPREDASHRSYVRFFVKGGPYSFLGITTAHTRLFGVDALPDGVQSTNGDKFYSRIYLMGADLTGRDIFSRICYGARISMTIGLIGVFFVLVIGLIIGGASGYFGGRVDDILYSFAQMVMLLPGFYLLLMLRFVFPAKMDSAQVYFAVILILSLVGWPGFAIVIRGMVKSIVGQDFIQAARAIGLENSRIIGKHVLPNTIGYTVVAMTLRIPGYILGEAALSILGLGIMEPTASWGNMLEKAMNIAELDQHPWVLWPGVFIFLAVMCFNLVGDGLRDAVDPRMHKT